ncbi:related to DNA-directed DNA polymerase lambda [Rhynchosporium secalis]|uniref:DNA-directed DNA polymerase n=1 Tax=Rhynchosporium secalis TaxID=38038 RepID=A0A1E1MNH7_RHYSE|nr:related to DNA-directed DNA polymerase lambda [Rhynchosporium secalis]
MQDKEEYFRQLYSLNDCSDDEVDTNDAREILRQSKPPHAASFPASQASRSFQKRSQTTATGIGAGASFLKKSPGIHRTTSAPVASTSSRVVNEVLDEMQTKTPLPQLKRRSSLLRHDISASTYDLTISEPTPENANVTPATPAADISTSKIKPVTERSASTPNIGSVVMNNSKGIAAMLGKRSRENLKEASNKKGAKAPPKGKAKKDTIKLAPEAQRCLKGKTIFWIPPNDVVPLRKRKIDRAREFGATWTKEANITHVVVDNDLSYQDVMKFLSPTIKSKNLPRHITLVNENYIGECATFKLLLDHGQTKYQVTGYQEVTESQTTSPPDSQQSEQSLQLKAAKSRKGDHVPERVTPSQSQRSTQPGVYGGPVDTSVRVSLMPGYHQEIIQPQQLSITTPLDSNVGKRGDDLDEWIDLARRVQDLPLDDEGADFDEDLPSASQIPLSRDEQEESGSEEERAWKKKMKTKRKYKKYPSDKLASFTCMHGGTGKTHVDNPNRRTIEILEQMAAYYGRIKDGFRERAYQKACGTLKKLNVYIESAEDAIRLETIGESIAAKIEEIVVTGHLRRLDNALNDSEDILLQLFLKIYGVGLSQAHKWIQAGHKTLEDLSKIEMHKNQRIGIEHYYDFDTRIPRDEVTALGDIVIKAAKEIDDKVELIIGGSYRRGASTSGDIDFIITKRNTSSPHDLLSFLNKLTKKLEDTGFLVAALAVPKELGSKWHGACVLPGNPIWRRIDFLVVPETEFGAALLYFTGDDIFNRSMRLLASKYNMRLNQRGLYKDVLRVKGREKLTVGTLIEGADERKIFDLLGVPWRPPHERICR